MKRIRGEAVEFLSGTDSQIPAQIPVQIPQISEEAVYVSYSRISFGLGLHNIRTWWRLAATDSCMKLATSHLNPDG